MWPWFIPRNRAEASDLWVSLTNVFARIGGFWAQEREFLRFLEGVPARAPHRGGAAPAVVVGRPWCGSPEPWFMITLALLIEQRYRNAHVLFDHAAINSADYPHV